MITTKRSKPAIFRALGLCASLLAGFVSPTAGAVENWFEEFKASADDRDLYRFLYALPKGGDLHNHLTGSNFSEWWYELATNKTLNGGYEYYTQNTIEHFRFFAGYRYFLCWRLYGLGNGERIAGAQQ